MNDFDTILFFGVSFYRKTSKKGDILEIGIPKTILNREDIDDLYLCTKGSYETFLQIDGEFFRRDEFGVDSEYSIRNIGFYSEDIPYGRKFGIYRKEAKEDAEWWCAKKKDFVLHNYSFNKKHLNPEESFVLSAGKKYAFLSGNFVINDEIEARISPVPVIVTTENNIITAKTVLFFFELSDVS